MYIKRLTILIFLLATIFLVGCEEWAPISIKNDTNQTLTIYMAVSGGGDITDQTPRELVGMVPPPNEIRVNTTGASLYSYLIEARNSQNQIVYSRIFMREELERMKWKVVISKSDLGGV